MSDLTLPNARGERDQLADRTDVLDKVGQLRTLPDDMHVMTEMVAAFYEVDREAIANLVKRNRGEFESDGYVVIARGEFEERFTVNLSTQSARIALFPRRAVLRVGMLLRDSDIARRVRDMLLDVEQADISGRHRAEMLTRADLARMVLEAEEEKSILAAALESAAPAIAYHEKFIAESDDIVIVKVWGAYYGLTEPQAWELLREKKIVYRCLIGRRYSESKGGMVDVYENRAYAGKTFDWFDLRPQHNAPRHHNGQVRQTLYVRSFFADELGRKCGLTRVDTEDRS
ncbi:MAG: phage antirepressor KilAC domain-containing protein [Gordonia sp. (in: high G+C Gram-positive bacteria)]